MGGLLAIGAVALLLLASGGSSAPKKKAGKACTKVDDLDEPLRSVVHDALATESNPDALDKIATDLDAVCPAVAQQVRDQAAVIRKAQGSKTGTTTSGGGSTAKTQVKFDANATPDPAAAHAAAYAIGKTKVPSNVAAAHPEVVAKDGTFGDLKQFATYYAGAAPMFVALQAAAGITPDGKYGPNTLAAFNYWFYRTVRPDGSGGGLSSLPTEGSGTEAGGTGVGGSIPGLEV